MISLWLNVYSVFSQVAKCDTCGRKGKLKQSLPMLGEVKHFCDLNCLVQFCCDKAATQGEVLKGVCRCHHFKFYFPFVDYKNRSVISLICFLTFCLLWICRYGGGHTCHRQRHLARRSSHREIQCFWQNCPAKYTTTHTYTSIYVLYNMLYAHSVSCQCSFWRFNTLSLSPQAQSQTFSQRTLDM